MSILSSTNTGKTRIMITKLVSLGMNPSKAVVNPDGTIDYDGDVTMLPVKSGKIPVTFNVIHGKFDCNHCGLTTLEGMPRIVEGTFNCSHNYLTSLAGAPKKAKGFNCSNNLLKSLEGGPKNVTGIYRCIDNKLTNLKGLAKCPRMLFIGDNYMQDFENDVVPYVNDKITVCGWRLQYNFNLPPDMHDEHYL